MFIIRDLVAMKIWFILRMRAGMLRIDYVAASTAVTYTEEGKGPG